ncbi:MAG: ATP-binding protein [Myxococcota bacterium]
MSTELGMLFAATGCLWLLFDAVRSPGGLRRWLPLGLIALCALLWTGGEWLLGLAEGPADRALARRVLFLGSCVLPPAWLWLAVRSDQPDWWQRHPVWLASAALPSLFSYGCLWLAPNGTFVNLTSVEPQPGPMFFFNAPVAWALMTLGFFHLARAALRRRSASGFRLVLFCTGVVVPCAANVVYVVARHGLGLDWSDPTPTLLGAGVLLFRASMVSTGLTLTLPMSRREVFDQLELGLLTVDLDHRVIDANRAAVRLLDVGPLRDRLLPPLLTQVREDARRPLEIRAFPLRGPLGVVGGGVVVADRSREVRTERQLRLAARLEAVGSLTAGIAHEVNNPLAYVRANLGQLEKWADELARTPLGEPWTSRNESDARDAADFTAEIREGVERINHIVDRLRRFARDDPPSERRYVDLADAVTRAATLARAGLPPESIELELAPLPRVWASELEIVQVVLNLLVNALHASGDDHAVEVRLVAEDGGALLEVMDQGHGIPPDLLPHIFDPFFTTKAPGDGTGLGLSVSHDIVRRHGGRLEAANRPTGGAVFSLWLPLGEAAGKPAADAAIPSEAASAGDRPPA